MWEDEGFSFGLTEFELFVGCPSGDIQCQLDIWIWNSLIWTIFQELLINNKMYQCPLIEPGLGIFPKRRLCAQVGLFHILDNKMRHKFGVRNFLPTSEQHPW